MTQQQYIIKRKLNILDFGEQLGNISDACRWLGVIWRFPWKLGQYKWEFSMRTGLKISSMSKRRLKPGGMITKPPDLTDLCGRWHLWSIEKGWVLKKTKRWKNSQLPWYNRWGRSIVTLFTGNDNIGTGNPTAGVLHVTTTVDNSQARLPALADAVSL